MTPSYPKRLAIVPAYNEEETVVRVVKSIQKHAPEFDIVVIDDGSTDRTARRAEKAGAIVLRHPFNLGIGGAVQSGFYYAMIGGYDLAVQVDGDGQHDPAYLPGFVDRFQKTPYIDVVCGTRFREGPGYKVPRHRRLGMLIFSWVLSALVRQHITDPTSGFRMMNRRRLSDDEPARDRAVRARLPARLPRGRGHPDDEVAPAPPEGGPGEDACARRG
jgi:glycosyltransferase involved in cell wall biosynthesis